MEVYNWFYLEPCIFFWQIDSFKFKFLQNQFKLPKWDTNSVIWTELQCQFNNFLYQIKLNNWIFNFNFLKFWIDIENNSAFLIDIKLGY